MGHSPSCIYEPPQGRYSKAQCKSEQRQWTLFCSHLSSNRNKWLSINTREFRCTHTHTHTHTHTRTHTHTLQVSSIHPNNRQTLYQLVSHPDSTFTHWGHPVCFSTFSLHCGLPCWFSRIAQRHCVSLGISADRHVSNFWNSRCFLFSISIHCSTGGYHATINTVL